MHVVVSLFLHIYLFRTLLSRELLYICTVILIHNIKFFFIHYILFYIKQQKHNETMTHIDENNKILFTSSHVILYFYVFTYCHSVCICCTLFNILNVLSVYIQKTHTHYSETHTHTYNSSI